MRMNPLHFLIIISLKNNKANQQGVGCSHLYSAPEVCIPFSMTHRELLLLTTETYTVLPSTTTTQPMASGQLPLDAL